MARKKTASDRGRFSAKRKTEVVLRILRGEDLDALSREAGATAATLAGWRDAFLAGGHANLKSRVPDAQDEENDRLKAMVGELTMRVELLRERARALEAGRPLASRKSKG